MCHPFIFQFSLYPYFSAFFFQVVFPIFVICNIFLLMLWSSLCDKTSMKLVSCKFYIIITVQDQDEFFFFFTYCFLNFSVTYTGIQGSWSNHHHIYRMKALHSCFCKNTVLIQNHRHSIRSLARCSHKLKTRSKKQINS